MATGPKLRSVNSLIGAEALCEMSFKPSKPGRTRGDGAQQARSVKQRVETHGEARGVAGLARGGAVDLNQFDHASLREHGQLGAAREQLEAQLASGRGKGTPGVHMRCAPSSLCCEGSTGQAQAQQSRLTLLLNPARAGGACSGALMSPARRPTRGWHTAPLRPAQRVIAGCG